MNKKLRQQAKDKYNGLCAYSGTHLEDDWQVEHINPKFRFEEEIEEGDPDDIENLMPVIETKINY